MKEIDDLLRLAGEQVQGPSPAQRAAGRVKLNAVMRESGVRSRKLWFTVPAVAAALTVALAVSVGRAPVVSPSPSITRHAADQDLARLRQLDERIAATRSALSEAPADQVRVLRETLQKLRDRQSALCAGNTVSIPRRLCDD